MKIECYTDEERGVRGVEKGREPLKGTGYLTLRPGCQGAYQNQIIRPSITKIPEIIDDNEPVYKVYSSTKKEKEKSVEKGPANPFGLSDALSKIIWKEQILPMIKIIVIVISLV